MQDNYTPEITTNLLLHSYLECVFYIQSIYDLIKDPKEDFDIAPEATWILPDVMSRVIDFQKTLVKEPPIGLGIPDPYVPAK
jgi:hypothetical protein